MYTYTNVVNEFLQCFGTLIQKHVIYVKCYFQIAMQASLVNKGL